VRSFGGEKKGGGGGGCAWPRKKKTLPASQGKSKKGASCRSMSKKRTSFLVEKEGKYLQRTKEGNKKSLYRVISRGERGWQPRRGKQEGTVSTLFKGKNPPRPIKKRWGGAMTSSLRSEEKKKGGRSFFQGTPRKKRKGRKHYRGGGKGGKISAPARVREMERP